MWLQIQRLVALLVLVMLLPFITLLCLLVVFTSKGPFLYSQLRPGRNGIPMRVWKIRTMNPGADSNTKFARGVTNDCPEITAIGKVLRQLKLDELPQLWNIVKGEMTFVGPRPIAFSLHQELCEQIPDFEKRNSVHPGLSNIAQVSIEENSDQQSVIRDWRERFQAELHYINNQSIAYDLIVIAMTALYVFRKLLKITVLAAVFTDAQSSRNTSRLQFFGRQNS